MRIVVVGAGPAGLAAACCAAESGARVTLLDDNPTIGGQIWRGGEAGWAARLTNSGAELVAGARVISATSDDLLVERGSLSDVLPFDKLILATGARELFLPFPGWTLPGVMGAGGLQALVKSGLPVAGHRIAVAGTGPLLLAVASHLKRCGAHVLLVAEQAPWSKLRAFARGLPASKWAEAARLWNWKYSPDTWITRAQGTTQLQSVTTNRGCTIPCDYLAIGYGLVRNTELADLLGCDPFVADSFQETDLPNIYAAGEITGIGGVDLSIYEGSIAGYAAAGEVEKARAHFPSRERWQCFARSLADAFDLRPELRALPAADTIVCRCEDVTFSRLECYSGSREAKLQTRCGMGPCQGRICGPATSLLFGWPADSCRPPVFPARVGSLIVQEKGSGTS